ncbi:unconventional myosin-IXa isoform X2 [Ixodes scapularis]
MDKGNPTLDPSSPPPDLPTLAAVQLRKMGLRAPKLKLTKASDAGQASCSSPAGSAIFGVAIEEQPMVLSQDSGLLVPRLVAPPTTSHYSLANDLVPPYTPPYSKRSPI